MQDQRKFVENVDELKESVHRFMKGTPLDWKKAVGPHPKYFVHYQDGGDHNFGLSKFCAFKNITLSEYLSNRRYGANGTKTQRYISQLSGQSWMPLQECNIAIRQAFETWFSLFSSTNLEEISIISLNMDNRASSNNSEEQHPARRYWAFHADPTIYRIEDAIRGIETDTWSTKGKSVRMGDRVLIWKTQGGPGGKRGVVALGEVISDPEIAEDDSPYWVDRNTAKTPEIRVRVRYVLAPSLPLWYGGEATSTLDKLSVSRGQGTVFIITPEQWAAVMSVIGGWPIDAPEVEDTRNVIAEHLGKRQRGQGFMISPEERLAIEQYAMQKAKDHYRALDWSVENVSSRKSYDLHCTRPKSNELRVEVKGTTSEGSQVILTPNEVEHAKDHYPNIALFIVANIMLARSEEGIVEATGGTIEILEPWSIEDGHLVPMVFQYYLPTAD